MEDFEIKTESHNGQVRITGFVEHIEVIKVNNAFSGMWMVGASSCLPTGVKKAKTYVDCMAAVMEKAREFGANV